MIYFLVRQSDNAVKIGTTRNFEMRLSALIRKYGDLTLLGVMDGLYQEERDLHLRFAHLALGKEWFRNSPDLREYISTNAHFNVPEPVSARERPLLLSAPASRFKTLVLMKQAEDRRAYTQEDIAKINKLSPATVSRLASGKIEGMSMATILTLCEWFDCQIGDLVYIPNRRSVFLDEDGS